MRIPTNPGSGQSAKTGSSSEFTNPSIVGAGSGAMGINLRAPAATLLSTPNFMGAVPEVRAIVGDPGYDKLGQNIAGTVGNVVGAVEKYHASVKAETAYRDGMWLEKTHTAAQKQWFTYLQENENNPEFTTQQFIDDYKKFSTEALNGAPSKRASEELGLTLAKLENQLLERSLNTEAKLRAEKTIVDFNELVVDGSEVVRQSGDIMTLYETQERLYNALDVASKMNKLPERVQDSLRDSVARISSDFAEYLIPVNPESAKAIIDNDKYIPLNVKTALYARLEAAKKTHDKISTYEQDKLLENTVAQIETTGEANERFDLKAYATVRGEDQAKKAAELITATKQVFTAKEQMMGKSPAEMSEILNKLTPVKDSPNYATDSEVYSRAQKFAQEQRELLNKDPFSYTLQDPVVKEAYAQAASNNSPVVLQGAIEASLIKQRSLGLVGDELSVLPTSEAKGIASKINSGDPASVENEFKALIDTYGKYYPDVFRDISGLPENERIDPKYQLVALHLGKPWLSTFIESLKIEDSKLGLTPEEHQAIKSSIRDSGPLNKFSDAITASSFGSTPFADAVRGSVEKYAKFLMSTGRQTSVSKSVKEAAEKVIESEYDFGESNGVTYAIKRNFDDDGKMVTDIDTKDVKRRLRSIQNGAYAGPAHGIDPAKIDRSIFRFSPLITEENQVATIKSAMSGMMFWSLAPDNKGFHLNLPGLDNTSTRVTSDGKPIYIPIVPDEIPVYNESGQRQYIPRKPAEIDYGTMGDTM